MEMKPGGNPDWQKAVNNTRWSEYKLLKTPYYFSFLNISKRWMIAYENIIPIYCEVYNK